MAGTIPAFLEDSFEFYVRYRGVWLTILIVISMSPTMGASVNGLLKRFAGTIVGGLLAMLVWYVVDQKIPGVIVLSWFVAGFRMSKT
jgi:uncharacterized membrane protein YccC